MDQCRASKTELSIRDLGEAKTREREIEKERRRERERRKRG